MGEAQISQAAAKSEGWCETCCAYLGKNGRTGKNRCHAFTAPPDVCPRPLHETGAPPPSAPGGLPAGEIRKAAQEDAPLVSEGMLL
jgi:hypothetical protein